MKAHTKLLATTLLCGLALFGSMVPAQAATKAEEQNKAIAENFWNEVFNKHNTDIIDKVVGDHYVQHSPSYKDGKQNFIDGAKGFLAEFPESTAEIDHIGVDGDYVYIHNHIKMNKDDRGQAAMDIFRLQDGKIVEHWDVIQDVPETAENDNTMFFNKKDK